MPSAIPLPPSEALDSTVKSLAALANDAASLDYNVLAAQSGALFARLKALNRDANASSRAQKQRTAEARSEMDQTHLGLQNLLYERRHLEREIEKCRQFG